jgi:hypothetical protein
MRILTLFLLFSCGSPSADSSEAPGSTSGSTAGPSTTPETPSTPSSSTTPSTTPTETTTTVGSTAGIEDHLTDLAGQVSQDELTVTIQTLQDLGTRYTGTEGNQQALALLTAQMQDLGLEVEEDHFTFAGGSSTNVIGMLHGTVEPDVVFVFQAHYDSTSTTPETDAPGADDNASGVAAVMEAARLLSGIEHHYSLWFVLTGAEEQGSEGSAHMVSWLAEEDVEVRGVIAPDMIGYWPLGEADAFDVLGDDASVHLAQTMMDVADLLDVPYKEWVHHGYCFGDDHTNWQEMGIPAIAPMDCVEAHNMPASGETTPHYHQTSDTLATLHMGFTTRVASVLLATLSAWGEPILE